MPAGVKPTKEGRRVDPRPEGPSVHREDGAGEPGSRGAGGRVGAERFCPRRDGGRSGGAATLGSTLLLVLAVLLFGAFPSQAEEPKIKEVYDKVRITGNEAFTEKALFAAAGITPPSKFQLFRKRDTLKREALENGLTDLVLFYHRNGYFEASARLADGGADTAEIRVSEGQPSRVSEVKIGLRPEDSATGEVSLDEVLGALPLKSGQIFTVQNYEDAQRAVTRAFKEHGFPFAETEAEADADLAAHQVAVRLWATPKGRAVFGTLTVQGIVHTEETIIRRAMAFKEGEAYDQAKVDESQNELYSLGLFETVAIWPKRKSDPGLATMVARIKEGRHRRIKIGLGYGSYEGVRTEVSWETLRVRDHVLTLGAAVKWSGIETTASGYLKRPFFLSRSNTLLADATLGKVEYPYFDFRSVRARFGVDHRFTKTLTGGVFLRATRVFDVLPDDVLERSVPPESRDDATFGSFEGNLTWRTADDLFSPTKGFVLNVAVEPVQDITNSVQFVRGTVEGKSYWSVTPSAVLALRLKLGSILTGAEASKLHITQRFYAGGPASVRGYRFNVLGPISPKGALLGGEGLLEASAELRFPLWKDLKGVLFLDAGNAFNKAYNYDISNLYYGTGVGVRYKTPVGPIGIDLAFRLKKFPLDDSPYLVYFFIGYAF